jgi:hypothetical protein
MQLILSFMAMVVIKVTRTSDFLQLLVFVKNKIRKPNVLPSSGKIKKYKTYYVGKELISIPGKEIILIQQTQPVCRSKAIFIV